MIGYCCTLAASSMRRALTRFPWLAVQILRIKGSGASIFSRNMTFFRTFVISEAVGDGIRIMSSLDRMGAIILLVLVQHRITRRLAMYFSMVLRRAAWASLERDSASWKTITLNWRDEFISTCWVWATSLTKVWITSLS